ncbi:MAG: hypothetical protein HKO65_20005 [Gemmatimonadetes bacterium]|nr:hypothetical protein [Gemmatimonadota bacterium]NNM07389.1 hypothetical protein [Gemmatimonadota bacterium]
MKTSKWFSRSLALLVFLFLSTVTQAAAQQAGSGAADEFPQFDFEGLFYLTYQMGENGGEDFSKFAVTRSYFTTKVDILPMLSARITMDARQDDTGDMKVRLKYAYGKFDFGDWGGLSKVNLEAGVIHMAWLDFEQKVNLYRMRDKMFMERSGLFNSADIGVMLAGGFGEDLSDKYQDEVSSYYPAKYGSWAVGVYNGGGYSAKEKNEDKTVQARVTVRPLPDVLPGFQFSGFGLLGEGNQEGEPDETPDYKVFNLTASYQFPQGTFTAQYVTGEGNQEGSWFEETDPSMATEYDGFSLFGEIKLNANWRLVGGFDDFTRTPEDGDRSFTRFHGGVGYDFGGRNLLLFDLDRRSWDDDVLETDTRFQTVMQVRF